MLYNTSKMLYNTSKVLYNTLHNTSTSVIKHLYIVMCLEQVLCDTESMLCNRLKEVDITLFLYYIVFLLARYVAI